MVMYASKQRAKKYCVLTGPKDDILQQMLAFWCECKAVFAYNLTCNLGLLLDTSGSCFETETV